MEFSSKPQVVVADTDPQYRSRLSERLAAAGYNVLEVANAVQMLECVNRAKSGIAVVEAIVAQELGSDERKGFNLIRKLPQGWGVILLLPFKNRVGEFAKIHDEIFEQAMRSTPQPYAMPIKIKGTSKDKEHLEREHLEKILQAVNALDLTLTSAAEARSSRIATGSLLLTFIVTLAGVFTSTLWLYATGVALIIISLIYFIATNKAVKKPTST